MEYNAHKLHILNNLNTDAYKTHMEKATVYYF